MVRHWTDQEIAILEWCHGEGVAVSTIAMGFRAPPEAVVALAETQGLHFDDDGNPVAYGSGGGERDVVLRNYLSTERGSSAALRLADQLVVLSRS